METKDRGEMLVRKRMRERKVRLRFRDRERVLYTQTDGNETLHL